MKRSLRIHERSVNNEFQLARKLVPGGGVRLLLLNESYIGNNPLSGTDPSGYVEDKEVESEVVAVEKKATTGSRIKHATGNATVTTKFKDGSSVVTQISGNSNGAVFVATGFKSNGTVARTVVGGIAKADQIGSLGGANGSDSIPVIPNEIEKDERREPPTVSTNDLAVYLGLSLAQGGFENNKKIAAYWNKARAYRGKDIGVVLTEGEAIWTSRVTEFGFTYSHPSIIAASGSDPGASSWGGGDQTSYVRGAYAIAIYIIPRTTLEEINRRRSDYLKMSRETQAPVYVRWQGSNFKYYEGEVSDWSPPRTLGE